MPARVSSGSVPVVVAALASLLAAVAAAAPCPLAEADAGLAEGRERVYWFEIWDGIDQDRALDELAAYIRTLSSVSALLDVPECSVDPGARDIAVATTLSLRSAYRQWRYVARSDR